MGDVDGRTALLQARLLPSELQQAKADAARNGDTLSNWTRRCLKYGAVRLLIQKGEDERPVRKSNAKKKK